MNIINNDKIKLTLLHFSFTYYLLYSQKLLLYLTIMTGDSKTQNENQHYHNTMNPIDQRDEQQEYQSHYQHQYQLPNSYSNRAYLGVHQSRYVFIFITIKNLEYI